MRLIDADALECFACAVPKKYDAKSYTEGAKLVLERIDKMPTIFLKTETHGFNASMLHPSDEFICSICGFCMTEHRSHVPYTDDYYEYNPKYCPECGAKMDGEAYA